jgi:uncharacterized protein
MTPEPKRRTFLTARWTNLILANYAVPDEILLPHLPPGVELDRWNGSGYASLVGFQFLETKVLGIGWPTFRNFPEWNLRIYVRHNGRRGVCFVREFVPQRFIAWVARLIYNEPYHPARLTMKIEDQPGSISAGYTVEVGGKTHILKATGTKPAVRPGPDSVEHFFKEQSWGFGRTHGGKLLQYEVNHPAWDVYPVTQFEADIDWGLLYGPEWEALNACKPESVVLAAGSTVSVYPHGTL